MNTYYFYSNNDSTKEAIYTMKAKSLENATVRFAKGKQLNLNSFNELYSVSEVV
jgi:hypothetical protein